MMRWFKRNEKRPLRCPRCGIVMEQRHKGDVTIDVCSRCHGMWLDDKEIDRLLANAKQKKKRPGKG